MLKVYNVTDYVSIDGAPWREVNCDGYRVSDEELQTELILDKASFDEAREFLSKNHLWGVCNESTFFRNKPVISVSYYSAFDSVWYKHFNTISYKSEYKEWVNVSLDWIMKHLSAEQCIQYLKDRGMATCPIMK